MCEIQCVCSFQCISVRTSHASMAGEAHVARGYPVGQRRPRLCRARGSDADILSRSLQRMMEWTRFPLSSTADLTKHLHRRYLFFWYSSEHCWCCTLSAPFHRIGNWGSDRLRDLSKTAHLEKDGPRASHRFLLTVVHDIGIRQDQSHRVCAVSSTWRRWEEGD